MKHLNYKSFFACTSLAGFFCLYSIFYNTNNPLKDASINQQKTLEEIIKIENSIDAIKSEVRNIEERFSTDYFLKFYRERK